MLRQVFRAFVVACVGVGLLATPAAASGGGVRREGACTGHGDWRLEVDRRDADTLRVRFRIEGTPAGKAWDVFLSDNGNRFLAITKTTNSNGEIRVSKNTRDRSGTDHLKAYAFSHPTGEVCSGSVAFG